MIILRQLDFSDKPKGLKKYKDYDGKKMSKAQQRAAIEEEEEIADHNKGRYQAKYGLKGLGHGVATGAVLGAGIGGASRKSWGGAAAGAGLGALYGAAVGGPVGIAVGSGKADKAGHNRDRRGIRLARRFDEENAKRGIDSDLEYQHKRDIHDRRQEELDAERNYYMAHMAYNSWR